MPERSKLCALLFFLLSSFFFPLLCRAFVFLQGWWLPISLHVCEMTRWGRPLSPKIRPRFVTVLLRCLGLCSTSRLPFYLSLSFTILICVWCGLGSSTPCIQIHSPKMHCQCRRCRNRCDPHLTSRRFYVLSFFC